MAKEHKVRDEDDVERLIDRYGMETVTEIRRANGSYRHRVQETDEAGRLDLYATGSPDQMAANIAALLDARRVLGEQYAAVEALIIDADGLGTGMQDGHGPIARAISARFRETADDAQGVVRALTDYRNELGMVIQAIHQTLASYDQTEVAAARRLTVSGGGNA